MLLLTAALAACCVAATGRVFDRCELVRELRDRHRLPAHQIATWVCIARHESEYNTSAINGASGDHGLFQISEIWWCDSSGGESGACGQPCSAFRDADIADDVACARRIYREHARLSGDGFNAWVVYPNFCKQDVHRFVDNCKDSDNLIVKHATIPTTTTPKYYTTTPSRKISFNSRPLYHEKLTTQKSTTRVTNTKNNIYSREIHKLPHKFIDHPTGSRYKYNINKSGFAIFKEN